MKKRKIGYFILIVIALLWGLWMWEVGFNTGKYSRQETPFNVPIKIVRSAMEGKAIEKNKPKLEENNNTLTIGKLAPGFSLPGQVEGELTTLANFKGKVVLLDFWASWCGDCRQSNSYLLDLYNEYKNKDFEIISISMDRNLRAWKKAIKTDQITWPQACDGKGVDSEVMIDYGIMSLPQTYLLDKEGIIIGKNMTTKKVDNWLRENL